MALAKKYVEARKKIDREKRYEMDEALELLPQVCFAKLDETVELALRLGVDPRHADQMVRGSWHYMATSSIAQVLVETSLNSNHQIPNSK